MITSKGHRPAHAQMCSEVLNGFISVPISAMIAQEAVSERKTEMAYLNAKNVVKMIEFSWTYRNEKYIIEKIIFICKFVESPGYKALVQ